MRGPTTILVVFLSLSLLAQVLNVEAKRRTYNKRVIEDFDEFRDSLADYNDTSGGVFVDAVPITNTKKTVRNEGGGEGRPSDFELAEDINKVQRLRTNRYHHHPKFRKFTEQILQ